MKNNKLIERAIHGLFLILGLLTVGCVLLITVYLVISGIPAITEIGLFDFLFGTKWASTADEASYGILPFILTSVYGTAGAILIGVPIGFFAAVYLSKLANPKVKAFMEGAVSLLAGIPSVVYGLVGMLVLVPAVREIFDIPDGASLFSAIIVLAIMILPSIIKVSMTTLEAVPKEYEDASLALGATPVETYFRVSVPAAKSGIAAAVVYYACGNQRYPLQMLEILAAVTYVRRNSGRLHIKPDKIAVMGFSAGGHAACTAGLFWQEDIAREVLDIEYRENRPDGMILCYPVITSGKYTHEDSIKNLLGDAVKIFTYSGAICRHGIGVCRSIRVAEAAGIGGNTDIQSICHRLIQLCAHFLRTAHGGEGFTETHYGVHKQMRSAVCYGSLKRIYGCLLIRTGKPHTRGGIFLGSR